VAVVADSAWRALLRRSFDEYYDGLWNAVAGLSVQERRFRATADANHIDFLVWHMARNEDGTISACAGTEQLWPSTDWPTRWGLSDEGDGCGFTSEQVAQLAEVEITELQQYFGAVRARTNAFLDALVEDALVELVWAGNPDVTVGQILGHLLVEQSQHLGQVALIRGLQRGSEFTTSWNNPETPTPS
jgi:uncharacterized damage-inducible protein DinB